MIQKFILPVSGLHHLSTYVVMQPESDNFIRNGSGNLEPIDSADLLKVYDAMQSVFNLGISA